MTTVVICGDETSPPPQFSDARVVVLQNLCTHLRDLTDWIADDETQLVLAVHRTHVDLGSIQAAVRRLGFDPLRVGILDLDTIATEADRSAPIAGTIARSLQAGNVDPAQVKLLPPDRSTRRALLSFGKPRYISAPGIDPSACHAADGCRVCVDRCPADALSVTAGAIAHDVDACVVCGHCVTACPAGAVENPTATAPSIEAEIRAVVSASTEPPKIRFRCRGAVVPAEPGWYQVEVPCTSMLTPGWVLAPLALGAAGVDVVACSAGGCPHRLDRHTVAMLEDTATIARELGIRIDQPVGHPVGHPVGVDEPLLGPGATARVTQLLAASDASWKAGLGIADIGQVTIDPTTCTACERCATVCPAGALESDHTADGVLISFDPRQCTGCASCLSVCPELERGAISLRRELDIADLRLGRRTVREEQVATCEICGAPVAPHGMLARIEAMLGEDHAGALAIIGRRCQRCRGR